MSPTSVQYVTLGRERSYSRHADTVFARPAQIELALVTGVIHVAGELKLQLPSTFEI